MLKYIYIPNKADFCSLLLRYINTVYVYNLSRLCTLNVDRSNKRKWLYTKKKKMISYRNYNSCRLLR